MNYNFDNIAGYEKEKEELQRLCEIFNNRQKYEKKGAKLPKGVIFYGEPGTGKTLFAKVMASECNLNIEKIDLGEANSDSAVLKKIRKAFSNASRSKKTTMIFFDEMDKVLPNAAEEYYTDRSKMVLAQLLTLIDGMDSKNNIVFVATCNYYGQLPDTLVRPGRIDKKICIGKPNFNSRVAILNMYAQKSSCKFGMAMDDIAKLSAGESCAALETLINECILQSDENGFISEALIRERFYEIKNEDINRGRSTFVDNIMACMNVGSFIVAKAFNDGNYSLSLEKDTVCNDFFDALLSAFDDDYYGDDYDDDDWNDDMDDYSSNQSFDEDDENERHYFAKKDYLNAIKVLLGGYACEEVLLNKTFDNLESKFDLIDRVLFKMSACGMLGLSHRFSSERDDILNYTESKCNLINETFDKIIDECYLEAKSIIQKNQDLAKEVVSMLLRNEYMDKTTLEPMLAEFGGVKC